MFKAKDRGCRFQRMALLVLLVSILTEKCRGFTASQSRSNFCHGAFRSSWPGRSQGSTSIVTQNCQRSQDDNDNDNGQPVKDGIKKNSNNSPLQQLVQKTAMSSLLALAVFAQSLAPAVAATSDDDMMASTTTTTAAATTLSPAPMSRQTSVNVRQGLNARRYWTIMSATATPNTNTITGGQEEGEDVDDLKRQANEGLLEYAVGTVNTMYYDNTGGARFTPQDFYQRWKDLRHETRQSFEYARQQQQQFQQQQSQDGYYHYHPTGHVGPPSLATREGAVSNLKWLISTLDDPFSKYLTRDELWQELHSKNDGFLGIGALVETPELGGDSFFQRGSAPTLATVIPDRQQPQQQQQLHTSHKKKAMPLSPGIVQNLPVVTAVVPDSPAERAGITVGDRIVAVGDYSFLGQSRQDVTRNFQRRFVAPDNMYFGHSDVTVAKPMVRTLLWSPPTTSASTSTIDAGVISSSSTPSGDNNNGNLRSVVSSSDYDGAAISDVREREVVIGYRPTRVKLPTKSIDDDPFAQQSTQTFGSGTGSVVMAAASATLSTDAASGAAATTNFVASAESSSTSTNGLQGIAGGIATPTQPIDESRTEQSVSVPTRGGNAIVHWELLSAQSPQQSIFQRVSSETAPADEDNENRLQPARKIGYIRLTRFSKASTAGYMEAVQALEDLGATSFIIDCRNNYGGVIQEAMLVASSLLRDPHAVLCYTMNARGGFTPHDVEEYVVDKRYPGYLLSQEPKWVTLRQAQQENPAMFEDDGTGTRWSPPSSYASLHEQTSKRNLHRPSLAAVGAAAAVPVGESSSPLSVSAPLWLQWNSAAANAFTNHNEQWLAQRNLVILINEGTASAAEVFASSLHDNGRTLALVGTKTYGKGLIQHTFPMPDGGGLRLTVAEYLTPALRHVTVVGNAKFDPLTGDQVGGGIQPDIHCESKHGIPSNVGADLCVGMALDVLEEADAMASSYSNQDDGATKNRQYIHRQQHPKERHQEDWTKQGILVREQTKQSMPEIKYAYASSATISRDSSSSSTSMINANYVDKSTVLGVEGIELEVDSEAMNSGSGNAAKDDTGVPCNDRQDEDSPNCTG